MLRLGSVQKHSRGLHKMSALDYFNKHVRDTPAASANNVKNESDFDSWCNACTYKCPICKMTEKSSEAMSQHFMTEHGLTQQTAESQHGSAMSSQIIHFCLVCQSPVLHDVASLNEHMAQHGLTLLSYYVTHIDKKSDVAQKSDEIAATSALTYDSLWMNKCVFRCKICATQLSSMSTFKRHISDNHAMNMDDYNERHGKISLVVANYHLCSICKCAITCDEEYIREHMVNSFIYFILSRTSSISRVISCPAHCL